MLSLVIDIISLYYFYISSNKIPSYPVIINGNFYPLIIKAERRLIFEVEQLKYFEILGGGKFLVFLAPRRVLFPYTSERPNLV